MSNPLSANTIIASRKRPPVPSQLSMSNNAITTRRYPHDARSPGRRPGLLVVVLAMPACCWRCRPCQEMTSVAFWRLLYTMAPMSTTRAAAAMA